MKCGMTTNSPHSRCSTVQTTVCSTWLDGWSERIKRIENPDFWRLLRGFLPTIAKWETEMVISRRTKVVIVGNQLLDYSVRHAVL